MWLSINIFLAINVTIKLLEQVGHRGEASGDAGVLHPVLHHQVGLQVRPEAAALPHRIWIHSKHLYKYFSWCKYYYAVSPVLC